MKRLRVLRAITGLSLLCPVFYPLFTCPFLIPWIMCPICPVFTCPFRFVRPFVLWFLLFSSLVFGRVFCGWLCPLGFLQETLGFLRGLRGLARATMPSTVLFIFSLLVVLALRTPWIPFLSHLLILVNPLRIGVRLTIFVAILFLSLFIYRFWCCICPVGFFTSLFNKFSLLTLHLRQGCVRCSTCARVCRPGLNPLERGYDTLSCLRCLDCVFSCKRRVLRVKLRFTR